MTKEKLGQERLYIIEVEMKGKTEKLELTEKMICWDGFRKLHGNLVRGVPKRSREDCLKYCRHPGCEL